MSSASAASARLCFDGEALSVDGEDARCLSIDARCLAGRPVANAYAHVCALADPHAAVLFDDPAVQQARRAALATWIPLLGDALVCLTTLAVDESRYGGAITVTRQPVDWSNDPFARIFGGTLVRTSLFSEVAPPAGPVIERYAGVAWPGGTFEPPPGASQAPSDHR